MAGVKFEGAYTSTGKYSLLYKIEVDVNDTEEDMNKALDKAKYLYEQTDKYAVNQKIKRSR